MSTPHRWSDAEWTDPDGGRIVLHGTLPTVVYPNALRPRDAGHGLALLESPDVVDLWEHEEADEAASPGVNFDLGLVSGGVFGRYLEGLATLEELSVGRYPDPEPRRLHRNAERHGRPVYFIEPLADDEDWSDYLTEEAKAVSHWRKLLGMIRTGKRWKRHLKHHFLTAHRPPKGVTSDLSSADVLASTWWSFTAWLSTPELNARRDARYAQRLRGALADLREHHGDKATLLTVHHMPHRDALLEALNAHHPVEAIVADRSSTTDEALEGVEPPHMDGGDFINMANKGLLEEA